MTKLEVQTLLTKHGEEITQFKVSTGQMMMLWKAVGAVALVALGTYITSMVGS